MVVNHSKQLSETIQLMIEVASLNFLYYLGAFNQNIALDGGCTVVTHC